MGQPTESSAPSGRQVAITFMKNRLFLFFVAIASQVSAQAPLSPSKKDPFANSGNTLLDQPNALPPAAATATSGGIKLQDRWDTPTALIPRGPKIQREEFHRLLTGFAEVGRDTRPAPGKTIYREVAYLMPMKDALAKFGLTGGIKSGGEPSYAGFPAGVKYAAFSAQAGRSFEVRVLYDRGEQVVAVEFAATNPTHLPPLPLKEPDRAFVGKYYDFLPRGDSTGGRGFQQYSWDMGDHVIIATRGGPKAADLYLPKPFASLILYCLAIPER